LQNGMKWDFVDAFLPSRYFFSESILNNQFPLWNPYLLYGTPIYADLVSVFNPEFWIIGNMFGYSNIALQFVFLAYIFLAGVSFSYFLKQFNADYKLSIGLSIAYMLSGFVIGNSQHVAFVSGYALIPFLITCYLKFIRQPNKTQLVHLSIALFLMIYCSYPALTIIAGYFLLCILMWYIVVNWLDKNYLKKIFIYHAVLLISVLLFSATLVLAYFQLSPFLNRFSGLPLELVQKHPFSIQSLLSFLTPMATGNNPQYFKTDISFSNAYWGIISLVLFLFVLTKKAANKESYLFLGFGIFALLASFGNQFFVREWLYNFAPFMNRFQYPGIFRAFVIFSFLAFVGINFKESDLNAANRKRLFIVSGSIILILILLIWRAGSQIVQFAYFKSDISFSEELFQATRFDNIVLQGVIQIIILFIFIFIIWKIKPAKYFSTALLLLFIADGIVSTQLSIHYTVLSKTNPVQFYNYLKSSPKGFPIPDLNPIGENTDKNAGNEFTWMNNNVFPKKITFDGLVSFKIDGYNFLSDTFPNLFEAIKKEPVIYFSDDVQENSLIKDFNSNTIFLQSSDYNLLKKENLRSGKNDSLEIKDFSPTKIEIKTRTEFPQLLTYQQNYYKGWRVYIDGIEKALLKSNFTHMSVLVPAGEHKVLFKYTNKVIIYTFCFTTFIFFILIVFSVRYYIARHPNRKKRVIILLISIISVFILVSCVTRYFYNKNKLGLIPVIAKNVEQWKSKYKNDISVLLSTSQEAVKNEVHANASCFINEKNNVAELSYFLMHAESKYFAFAWQGGIIGDDLFELIYSFYPTIIQQKRTNNSGIILLEKSAVEQSNNLIETFEPDSTPCWLSNQARITFDSISNSHTYFYNENEEFGTSLEFPVVKDMLTKKKITLLADFMIQDKLGEVLLVFTTDRAGEMQIYQTLDISQFAKYPDTWSRAVYDIPVSPEMHEGDIIKIYFWNIKRAKFQIDNLKLKE